MVSSELLKRFGFELEEIEELPFTAELGKGPSYRKTGHPRPKKRYKIIWEGPDLSIEEPYYWMYNYLEQDLGFGRIIKTEDVFAAAENSAFFGVSQQRLGAQQDKISQYLATIGKMIKELFQLVRELRIIDERMGYYYDVEEQLKKPVGERVKGSEITLKGIFIDLVQGGSKSPASVYGMSRELEFTPLPDIFFDVPPMKKQAEIDAYVDVDRKTDKGLQFNQTLLRVLVRHLIQYTEWRERTKDEMEQRRRFTLQYLQQHFDIIRMYMTWVKPYLRHTQRLSMKPGFESDPQIVSSFESSMIDVEMMGCRKWNEKNSVVMITFHYRTKPSLKFVQEGYQRGPIHVGRMEMFVRGYIWDDEQIKKYVEMKEAEDFELMKTISGSVEAAMNALGDDFQKYYEQARAMWRKDEKKEEHKEEKHEKESIFRKMFHDFLGPKKDKHEDQGKDADKKKKEAFTKGGDDKNAEKDLKHRLFLAYKNFKKGHGMIMW